MKSEFRRRYFFGVFHKNRPSHISPQHHCGSEAEREQDPLGALFFAQSLRQPHLSEPHQERHQLRGGRSVLGTVQPAGEQQN